MRGSVSRVLLLQDGGPEFHTTTTTIGGVWRLGGLGGPGSVFPVIDTASRGAEMTSRGDGKGGTQSDLSLDLSGMSL